MVTKETKDVLRGKYGRLPVEPDSELVKKILGDEERITCRPADLIEPEYEQYKKEIAEFYEKEEDVLSYAMFPQVALNYFKYRQAKKSGLDANLVDSKNNVHPI